MTGYRSGFWRSRAAGLVLLCAAAAGAGESPRAGIYFGDSFEPICEDGSFAVAVRSSGTSAIIMGFDNEDEEGFVATDLPIAPDGSFSSANIDGGGTEVTGSIVPPAITGTVTEVGCDPGIFSVTRAACGDTEAGTGFYEGTGSGTVTVPGKGEFPVSATIDLLIAGDGNAFAYLTAFAAALGEYLEDGGGGDDEFGVSSQGVVSGELDLGTQLSGTVDFGTGDGAGTFFAAGDGFTIDGIWSVSRTEVLTCPEPSLVLLQAGAVLGLALRCRLRATR